MLTKPYQKTANISVRHHRFPSRKTSGKRAQKFHTDHVLLPRSNKHFWLVVPQGKFSSTNQKHYPDPNSNTFGQRGICGVVPQDRYHFEGKPEMSRNVECLPRLTKHHSTTKTEFFNLLSREIQRNSASISLFGKRLKNSFFLSQIYSLLSNIPFLFRCSTFKNNPFFIQYP